jgi:hypothetical protein
LRDLGGDDLGGCAWTVVVVLVFGGYVVKLVVVDVLGRGLVVVVDVLGGWLVVVVDVLGGSLVVVVDVLNRGTVVVVLVLGACVVKLVVVFMRDGGEWACVDCWSCPCR